MNELTYRPSAKDSAAFASLPLEHQAEVTAMLDVFAAVDAAPHKTRMAAWEGAIRAANAALDIVGVRTRFTVKGLYGIRSAFRAAGNDWTACVDRRKVPDWSTSERRRTAAVPPPTVQWWRQMHEQFKGRENCLRQAYERVVAVWSLGSQPIPGYEQRPAAGPEGYPPGWSYANFCRLCRRTQFEKRLCVTGAKAAANLAFHVPTSRVDIAVGEFILLDDVWHDIVIKRTLHSRPMRLLELCALDLRSGKKICYGLKPETIDDETGARTRLQERDMRFLLAALFHLHGYRPQGTTLLGERGTAVVRDDVARVLADATDGAIRFQAGAVRDTPAFPGWYKARGGGNPRFKAALESSFNLAHNAFAMLPAQTGSNERVNAPEELAGRKDVDAQLVKALAGVDLSPEQALAIRAPFMLYSQAARIVGAVYDWLDGRTHHDLEGWEAAGLVTGEVRVDPRCPDWTPVYALAATTPDQQEALSAMMRLPGCYRMRKLSPAEVWERDSTSLARLPAHVLPALIGRDLADERKVNDHGSFLFQDASISPEPLRYVGIAESTRGHEVMLREGETYLTFCNPFDPRYLLVCDARGAYIGRCLRVDRPGRADSEELAVAMGQAAHVNALRMRAFRARNAWQAEERQEVEAGNAKVLAEAGVVEIAADRDRRARELHARVEAAGDLDDLYGDAPAPNDGGGGVEQEEAAAQLGKLF